MKKELSLDWCTSKVIKIAQVCITKGKELIRSMSMQALMQLFFLLHSQTY